MTNPNYSQVGIKVPVPMTKSPGSNPGIVYNPSNIPTSPGAFLSGQTIQNLTFQANNSQRRIRISMATIAQQANKDPGQEAGSVEVINADGQFVASIGDNTDDVGSGGSIFSGQDFVGTPGMSLLRPFGLDFTNISTLPLLIVEDDAENDNSAAARFEPSLFSTISTGAHAYFSFTAATKKIHRTSGSFITDGFLVGMLITVTGSASNDGTYTIAAVTATDITVNETLVDEAAGATITIAAPRSSFGYVFEMLGVGVYVSDGTTPNGNLSATQGSICLNASGTGQIAYCQGGTAWTLLT